MKRFLIITVMIFTTLYLLMPSSLAEQNGLFEYSLKPDNTIIITAFDWNRKNDSEAIIIPSEIDGHIVTEIGEYAFADKRQIDNYLEEKMHMYAGNGKVDLILPNTITKIGAMAFFGSDVNLSGIPASVEEIGYGAFSACKNGYFVVDSNNPVYAAVDGALYCKKTKELIAIPGGYAKVTVPDGIVKIAPWACCSCDSLSLSLPETIEEIGDYAFWGSCDLGIGIQDVRRRRIILPSSVKKLGQYAFACLWNMGSAKYPLIDLSQTQITELSDYAFYKSNCEEFLLPQHLEVIGESAIDSSEPKIATLPDSLRIIRKRGLARCHFSTPVFSSTSQIEEIGDEAFSYCYYGLNAESLVLPNTLLTIGSGAFNSYTSVTITIPANVKSIAPEIGNREELTIFFEPGTYAEQWANENNYVEDLSWLD